MKHLNLLKITALTLALSSASGSAFAGTMSGTGTASATLLKPGSIVETTQLNFGSFMATANSSSSSITIQPTAGGNATYTSASKIGDVSPTVAKFMVTAPSTGISGKPVIQLPDAVTLYKQNGDGETMTINTFTSSTLPSGMQANSVQPLYVGGTLNFSGESQAPGVYEGSYTVSVNY